MAATATNSVIFSQRVLADLVEHLDVDISFLRYNEHNLGATKLIRQWPPRDFVPNPDPIGVFRRRRPGLCEHRTSEGARGAAPPSRRIRRISVASSPPRALVRSLWRTFPCCQTT